MRFSDEGRQLDAVFIAGRPLDFYIVTFTARVATIR